MALTNKEINHPITFHFSSERRTEGSISNFTSEHIDLKINNYDSCCLLEASIPRTFYNISTKNNSFILIEDSTEITIQLPEGSYTVQNIIATLTTELNTKGTNEYAITYKTSIEPQDFKFTFNLLTNNNPIQPIFNFTTQLYKVLGFNKNSSNQFSSNTLKSTNCINLSRINSCFIKTDMINSNESILQEFLSYGSFQMLSIFYFYNQNLETSSREFVKSQGVSQYNFQLIDEDGEEIDLNGINYSFSIMFFNRNKSHELQQNEIKLNNLIRQFEIQKQQIEILDSTTKEDTTESNETKPTPINPTEPPPEFYTTYKPQFNQLRPNDTTLVNPEYL